jgi:predicted alpha/beta superfamily hydrolase
MTKFITKLVAILCISSIQAQQKHTTTAIIATLGTEYKMASSILKEERTLLIHTPDSYGTSSNKYGVIYVLDGDNHFNHAINATTLLAENGRMPETIIVAIPNNRGIRGRDLGRGRDDFKKYINEEVIPFVNNNYRTSKHKTLFGHSMAGAFTLNYLATNGMVFDNYIAASPVVQIFNSELLTQYSTLFKTQPNISKPLYFSIAGVEAEGQVVTDAMNTFVALLKKDAPKSFPWEYDFIPNQVHMTTPYLTMFKGLTAVFNDFQSPTYSSFAEYTSRGGIQQLKAYYTKRAQKYNTKNTITDNTLRRLASILIRDKQEKLGIELLELNTKNNPSSMGAFNTLARAYEGLKQFKNAAKSFEGALKIAERLGSPNSAYFKRQLERLEE